MFVKPVVCPVLCTHYQATETTQRHEKTLFQSGKLSVTFLSYVSLATFYFYNEIYQIDLVSIVSEWRSISVISY